MDSSAPFMMRAIARAKALNVSVESVGWLTRMFEEVDSDDDCECEECDEEE
jgi:hypothetical protein